MTQSTLSVKYVYLLTSIYLTDLFCFIKPWIKKKQNFSFTKMGTFSDRGVVLYLIMFYICNMFTVYKGNLLLNYEVSRQIVWILLESVVKTKDPYTYFLARVCLSVNPFYLFPLAQFKTDIFETCYRLLHCNANPKA